MLLHSLLVFAHKDPNRPRDSIIISTFSLAHLLLPTNSKIHGFYAQSMAFLKRFSASNFNTELKLSNSADNSWQLKIAQRYYLSTFCELLLERISPVVHFTSVQRDDP